MNIHAEKKGDNKSRALANHSPGMARSEPAVPFREDRSEDGRKLQDIADSSLQVSQFWAIQKMADNSPRLKQLRASQQMADSYKAAKMPGNKSAGVDAKITPIQMVSYSSLNANPYRGTVDVDDSSDEIVLTGALVKKDDQSEVAVNGSVSAEEYSFPEDRSSLPVRASDSEEDANALRVHNLGASPRRVNLGQLLTYHHGLKAIGKSLPHVIAMNVTGARGPFYEPMGFTDYKVQPGEGYRDLETQRNSLDTLLRSDRGQALDDESVMTTVTAMNELTNKMAESPMIIGSGQLVANSFARWSGVWREGNIPEPEPIAEQEPIGEENV